MASELDARLKALGASLFTLPAPTGDVRLRLDGWRDGIEEHGQALWGVYHWIVKCQDGKTHGIYRLRDWLDDFNVPDNTDGKGGFPVWR